ncbi:hypothetical protein AB4Z48_39640 [Cupriavidus sp. 2TAF22]|uniref:hypothetical protein n=1 Tax=unclassified Cupriavidus TaxID=2640874 RepID=UPI003F91F041
MNGHINNRALRADLHGEYERFQDGVKKAKDVDDKESALYWQGAVYATVMMANMFASSKGKRNLTYHEHRWGSHGAAVSSA